MFQNYITMKKLLTLIAIALAVVVSSCSKFDDSAIWDKLNEQEQTLNDHEKRIAALEELCKQMNTNINALQTLVEALEKRDYITNVSPVREDGVVVGYTISFASSDTITIYNGKDGVDGTDGKDGYTPQIGVMKDTDGIYYWTLDGEWLLDGKGNKIQANGVNGIDGTDGSNGEDGTNGVDGITPRLKIENDYWYVSYDEGATWIELGRATGEDGSDGADGDNIFSSVTQDGEYVYFNLADGTMITLPKHDNEHIQFEDLLVKSICCKHWDTNNDGELSYAEAAAVTDIGLAFRGNSNIIAFTELRYFTGLTSIPGWAFSECFNLWEIIIPDGVTSIGDAAFNRCSGLKEFKGKFASVDGRCLVVDEKLISFAQYGLTEYTIPDGVMSIGDYAFSDCDSLTSVTIPDSVTSIGYRAFSYCDSLTSITIPDSVTSIGDYAFSGCNSLTSVYITDIAAWCKISFGTSYSNPLYYAENLYLNNELVTDLIIPDGVTKIGSYAFCYCTSLTSITIPDSATSIGDHAFMDCDSLTSITIPDSVTSIGNDAFRECDLLTSVTIGNGVTSIGDRAFSDCYSLKEVYCKPTTPPTGGNNIFYNNASGRTIYVPRNSLDAYKSDIYWSKYANAIIGYDFENNSI